MKTTLDLPEHLFERAAQQAARMGVDVEELIARFVDAGLKGQSGIEAAPNERGSRSDLPVVLTSTGMKIPFLTNSEIQEILERDEIGGAR